jgi:hypothetical protein
MNSKRANAVILLILCISAMHFVSQSGLKISPAYGVGEGMVVDLFTNKSPYDGRGINQISDAFSASPPETIVLFTFVSYNGDPIAGLLVAFQITAPTSSLNQILSAQTNQSGVATIMFNLPQNDNIEQMAFGTWFVSASASIGQLHAIDTLTFRVGYLVTATMKTVAPAPFPLPLIDKQNFAKGTEVGVVITLTNIALSAKDVTLTFVVLDALNREIYISRETFTMPPGNFTYPLIKFSIPTTAATGAATIALHILRVSSDVTDVYSPPKSVTFNILLLDVAVTGVNLSSTQVYIGQILDINVNVKNLGDVPETFNVTIYYDSVALRAFSVVSLEPNAQRTLTFSWNTSDVNEGTYTISAVASQVPDEANTMNNRYVADQVRITQRQTPTSFNPRDLYIILGIILILFLIALLALLVLRRGKKDETEMMDQISFFT